MEFEITDTLIAALSFALGAVLMWWTKRRRTPGLSTQDWVIDSTVEAACLAAEKMFIGDKRGAEKFAYVMNYVEAEAKSLGIKFNSDKVAGLIRDFVADMNKDLDKEG